MKQISSDDWFLAQERVKSVRGILCESHNEDRLFSFVFDRTLRFNKFVETIPLSHFRHGVNGTKPKILGYPLWHWSTLNFALHSLTDRNILAKKTRGSGMSPYYFLNVPGILEFLLSLDPKDGTAEALADKVGAIYDESGLSFPGIVQCKEEVMVKLEDSIKKAEQRSADALAKRQAHRVKNSNPIWVKDFLHEYCKGEGIRCYDDWTKKTLGQAKWWLNMCARSGVDPRLRLKEICDNWDSIRLFMRKQHRISFKHYVNFTDYISQYRRVHNFLQFGDIDDPGYFDRVLDDSAEGSIKQDEEVVYL